MPPSGPPTGSLLAATRAIPSALDPAIVADIDARLDAVEREERVAIGFAIESGSRAWGFPSPDSDYDCRFVYVRAMADYVRLYPPRDVIETPMTAVLDVNGWDLQKALKLLINGNAVIIEWLTSPIVYRAHAPFRSDFLAFAEKVAERNRVGLHYLHLGRRIFDKSLDGGGDVALKKIFYALRPALAIRWLIAHPDRAIAPMNFHELRAGLDLDPALSALIDELLARKAETREMGSGPLPNPVRDAIFAAFDAAEREFSPGKPVSAGVMAEADAFFRRWVGEFAPR
ncbi:MAG: nucleotidyltransferase domain-containing protein [Hyphomicrobium sp.]|nr:nucleotidyltransferase domain-containing protein [Hyphomicrobium sp.]